MHNLVRQLPAMMIHWQLCTQLWISCNSVASCFIFAADESFCRCTDMSICCISPSTCKQPCRASMQQAGDSQHDMEAMRL